MPRPEGYRSLDALISVSFGLECGCRTPILGGNGEEDRELFIKGVGSEYPCKKHGEQIIVRRTTRLEGWRK